MENKGNSEKSAQEISEDFNINIQYNVDIVDISIDLKKNSESEASPSDGYRFVMWQMRVEA